MSAYPVRKTGEAALALEATIETESGEATVTVDSTIPRPHCKDQVMPDVIDTLLHLDAELAEIKRRLETASHPSCARWIRRRSGFRLQIGGTEEEPFT